MAANDKSNPASPEWGRRRNANSFTGLKSLAMMLVCPIFTLILWMTIEFHGGAISATLRAVRSHGTPWTIFTKSTFQVHVAIAMWIALQACLYNLLPGSRHVGQLTPAGHLLEYKTNGLLACFISCCLFGLLVITGHMKASFIATNWGSFLAALNVWGLVVTGLLYAKARIAPTHPQDDIFTGNLFYDLFMGVELNSHIANFGDIKLFINGRTGMMAWPLINISHAALQYENYGSTSLSMLVVLALQMIYIIDFFWNEHWYLQTVDVAHDHVGFYLAWGCIAWLPATYTLQAQYLARFPVPLSYEGAFAVSVVGLMGYLLFRSANNQKYRARNSHGQCNVWGRPATFIAGHYKTSDGVARKSILLTSGWWGFARHANYLKDLILSFSMCAACGTTHLLPWFYAAFMSLLLLHRCYRDETRCRRKYGGYWRAYCNYVPWRVVPYVL